MEKATCKQLVDRFEKAFAEDRLGLAVNSYRTTVKDTGWFYKFDGGKDRDIATITTEEVGDLIDRVSWGVNLKGEKMKPSAVLSIFYSIRRLLNFAVDEGLLTENPCDSLPREALPIVERVKKKQVVFNQEQGKKFVDLLVNATPTFSAIKAVACTYLCYRHRKQPGNLLTLTWADVDADKTIEADSFIVNLLSNYREAQKTWLEKQKIENVKNLVFVKMGDNCTGEEMPSGFVGGWLKDNIFAANPDLPRVTCYTLANGKVARDVFGVVDEGGDFPILGGITFPVNNLAGGGNRIDREAYNAARQERKARYEAKYNNNKAEVIYNGNDKESSQTS